MSGQRRCWVVLVRVHAKSDWCAYGPATHGEALAFKRGSTGTGIERQVAQLIPLPSAANVNDANADKA